MVKLNQFIKVLIMIALAIATTYVGYILRIWLTFMIAPMIMCCVCKDYPLSNIRFKIYLITLSITTILHWISEVGSPNAPLSFEGLEIAAIVPLITVGVILGIIVQRLIIKSQELKAQGKSVIGSFISWVYSIVKSKCTWIIILLITIVFVFIYYIWPNLNIVNPDTRYLTNILYETYGDDIEIGRIKYETRFIGLLPLTNKNNYMTTVDGCNLIYNTSLDEIYTEYNAYNLKKEILDLVGTDNSYTSYVPYMTLSDGWMYYNMLDFRIRTLSDLTVFDDVSSFIRVYINDDEASAKILDYINSNPKLTKLMLGYDYFYEVVEDTKHSSIRLEGQGYTIDIALSETAEPLWIYVHQY